MQPCELRDEGKVDERRLNGSGVNGLARFEAFQSTQTELAQTKNKLSERKLVERAKGMLMAQKKMSAEQAYHALRKLMMDRSLSMGRAAGQVIAVAKSLE